MPFPQIHVREIFRNTNILNLGGGGCSSCGDYGSISWGLKFWRGFPLSNLRRISTDLCDTYSRIQYVFCRFLC